MISQSFAEHRSQDVESADLQGKFERLNAALVSKDLEIAAAQQEVAKWKAEAQRLEEEHDEQGYTKSREHVLQQYVEEQAARNAALMQLIAQAPTDSKAGSGTAQAARAKSVTPGLEAGSPQAASLVPGGEAAPAIEQPHDEDAIHYRDAILQVRLDHAEDEALYTETTTLLTQVDRATQLTDKLCETFYGSSDIHNPAPHAAAARERLQDIAKRAVEGEERAKKEKTKNVAAGLFEVPKAVMCDIVKAAHSSLKEIVLRIAALQDHAGLKRSLEPPLRAPSSDTQPCALCGRLGSDAVLNASQKETESAKAELVTMTILRNQADIEPVRVAKGARTCEGAADGPCGAEAGRAQRQGGQVHDDHCSRCRSCCTRSA